MSDSPCTGAQPPVCKSLFDRRLALHSAMFVLAACVSGQAAFAQMELKNAQAMAAQSPAAAAAAAPATPNMNCTLIVPSHPLTAQGLATPYQLVGTDAAANGPCNEANPNQGAFVQAGIINLDTGQVSIYNPLVIDQGTKPAAAPVVPKLPRNSVVALWFGFNGNILTLQGAKADTLAHAKCVSGTQGSPFTQVSYCNAPNFFQAADRAIANGQLTIPPLGTGNDGQTCPTLRSFMIVDQDQSDNVTTMYLATANGQTAQVTAANLANLAGATKIPNPGDNILFSGFVDAALGCKPFMANDLANPGQQTLGLPLNELQARVLQAAPVGLVPGTDPMVLVNNNLSLTKDDLYRNGMDQPVALTPFADDGARYCRELLRIAPTRLFNPQTQALLTNAASLAPAVATNLFSFLGQRLVAAYGLLNCQQLTGFTFPVATTADGNGVFTGGTLNAAAYAQIQQQLQTTQAQDFATDSSANSMLGAVGGNGGGTGTGTMCGAGNTLPGAAASYGVFIPGNGNFNGANSQMTGSLAVGGSINLANYAVANQVAGTPGATTNPANIAVGGALVAANGGVGNGQQGTIYAANGQAQLMSFTAGGGVVASTPIDFNAAQSYYQTAATTLGALQANGQTQICDNCINFVGTSTTLNVFTVAGSALANANEINISAPAG
ncbi:MAG: choice-of-anchor A family protein, partial [Sinobacteraceae bacterium]|nr:choice-of-anchor A family protein [Nevskiaceae bacterium]